MAKPEDVDTGGLVKLDPVSGLPKFDAPAPIPTEEQKESSDAAPTA
jgi:hypothetical protein